MTQDVPVPDDPDGQCGAVLLARIKACVEELNRLDFLLVAATKRGSLPPPQNEIFDALSKATIACADAVEAAGENPLSAQVRTTILLLQVAITDLAATLKTYAKLVVYRVSQRPPERLVVRS